MPTATRTPWHIKGDEVSTCNCAWGCPCQFNALPTQGRCEALVATRIIEGHYGEVRLDGLAFAAAWWWPGAIHEGGGLVRPAIDERATPAQRAALLAIMSGAEGGALFEIFASTVVQAFDPLFVPITFHADQDTRRATLTVPGLGEFQAEPIRNPVTGQEHRARINLPNGFEYTTAEMGNAVWMHATVGDKTLDNRNTYAQFASVDWTNQ